MIILMIERESEAGKIAWFNTQFNKAVRTKIAFTIIRLIDKQFSYNKLLYKLITKKNLKVSYSCSGNIAKRINAHNTNILAPNENLASTEKKCDCQYGNDRGRVYLANNVVQCESEKFYIGVAEEYWKRRCYNHKMSMTIQK